MDTLRISLVQSDIIWENKTENLKNYGVLLKSIAEKTDLVVLPEMFSTGFSMDCCHLAETNDGDTISIIKKWTSEYQFAIYGSFLAKDENNKIFNRGFFITPDGKTDFYDKRHLFRLGDENECFTAGDKQVIVSYQGWNISLIICYDLRFPVWIRNVENHYDLLLCTANWPEAREKVWSTLLQARALENLCYVAGVNRIGKDGHQVKHKGDSMLINPKGDILAKCEENEESIATFSLNKEYLEEFRRKFPVWKDADRFEIK